MRRLLSSLMVGALLLSTGCARTSAPERALTPVQPTSSREPSIGNQPVDRIKAELKLWETYDEEAPDWVGVDEQGRLVVGGTQFLPLDETARLTQKWMGHPGVDQVLLKMEEWERYRGLMQGGVTVLTRARYDTGVAQVPYASPSQWAKQVDAYAKFVEMPIPPESSVRQWISGQVGNRLVQLDLQSDKTNIVLQPGSLPEEQRVSEAVALAAYALLSNINNDVTVRYRGVSKVQSVDVPVFSLNEWAVYSNDIRYLPGHIKIDGRKAEVPSWNGPVLPKVDLPQLLSARNQWKHLLPEGARLTIGQKVRDKWGAMFVEAEVPQSLSWEQAWQPYQEATGKLFSQARGLWEIDFVLHKGQETAFIEWEWAQWQVRNLAAAQSGGRLDPATFGPFSHKYELFRTVTP